MRGADHWTALIISGIKWGMSTLYIVATPIGNLEDITARALRILGEVNFIACEDTRVTSRLLNRYSIKKSLIAYLARNAKKAGSELISRLKMGESCALVTDAGTPGISDPGSELVARVRLEAPDISIVPIPGSSALTTFLSVAGIPSSEFIFLGFLPHKKGRQTLVREIAESSRLVIFYESNHRIEKALKELAEMAKERQIVVGREMTKIFEQFISGTPAEVLLKLQSQGKAKGEFVVAVLP